LSRAGRRRRRLRNGTAPPRLGAEADAEGRRKLHPAISEAVKPHAEQQLAHQIDWRLLVALPISHFGRMIKHSGVFGIERPKRPSYLCCNAKNLFGKGRLQMSKAIDSAVASQPQQPPAWGAVFSMMLGVFGLVTAEFLPASLLTPMARDLGVTEGMAGQAVTATAIVALATSLLVATLTRRIDRRIVLLAFSTWAASGRWRRPP
jgi:hypothetical protein